MTDDLHTTQPMSGIFLSRFLKRSWISWCTSRRRRLALHAKNERTRMRAACKLEDDRMLKKIALEANQGAIRHQAAMGIKNQALLAAVALNAWDIEQGCMVVERIDNDMLLRRVATSARQDKVRLAAAYKLGKVSVLKQIALMTADVSLRWEVAQWLNDPDLLADVALFKPSKPNFENYRRHAHVALMRRLDELSLGGHEDALLVFLYRQTHLPFKIAAFLRLPLRLMSPSIVQHVSRHDFGPIPREMTDQMFSKLRDAGWQIASRIESFSCRHCLGRGRESIKTLTAGQPSMPDESVHCPECAGEGAIHRWKTVCRRDDSRPVVFEAASSTPRVVGTL